MSNELNLLKTELRKLFKAGRLEYRRTYYDYYDSCHRPVETPDAPWVTAPETVFKDLYAGGPYLKVLSPGLYELSTGYMTYQLRLVGGAK